MKTDMQGMKNVFSRTPSLLRMPFSNCPGCGHSLIYRLVAEAIDELELADYTIGVGSIGCSARIYYYCDVDFTLALHGRAPAVATGLKRAQPDKIVFTLQGDGDLASIGMSEIVHAASRSENITVIFSNNAIYGMTGGQLSPNSLLGQITTTSPQGRDAEKTGFPIQVCELLATLKGSRYLERVAVNSVSNIRQAKKAIKRAFELQISGEGFSLVEVLSQCPIQWRMEPKEANVWVQENMIKQYPLGVFRD